MDELLTLDAAIQELADIVTTPLAATIRAALTPAAQPNDDVAETSRRLACQVCAVCQMRQRPKRFWSHMTRRTFKSLLHERSGAFRSRSARPPLRCGVGRHSHVSSCELGVVTRVGSVLYNSSSHLSVFCCLFTRQLARAPYLQQAALAKGNVCSVLPTQGAIPQVVSTPS